MAVQNFQSSISTISEERMRFTRQTDLRPNRENQPPIDGHNINHNKASPNQSKLKILLGVEAEIREAANLDEWGYVVANETRKIIDADQVFVIRYTKKPRLVAISGLPGFDRSGNLASVIESIAVRIMGGEYREKLHQFDSNSGNFEEASQLNSYPYRQMLWVPFLSRSGNIIGAMLLASVNILDENQQSIAQRIGSTYSHALGALVAQSAFLKDLRGKFAINKWHLLVAALIVVAILCFPVAMATLAPFSVAPRNPVIVASPLDGVIKDIPVKPNETVEIGQTVLTFEDTVLHNRYELSQRDARVAAAQVKKASQLAFDDSRGQQEVRAAMANHALKISTQSYAEQMLDRTIIKAQRRGVVIYSDKNSLIGKPVKLGERILQIADPASVDLYIDVAVDDAILLDTNAKVKIFLDSDPVNSRNAIIEYIEYQPREHTGNILSFRVVAQLENQFDNIPRIGVRGTAKLYGDKVPLAFYLFRRPLSAIRQWIGI